VTKRNVAIHKVELGYLLLFIVKIPLSDTSYRGHSVTAWPKY